MRARGRWRALGAAVFTGLALGFGAAARAQFLFDATKAEMAGNADWVIDADLHNLNVTNGNGSGTGNRRQGLKPRGHSAPAAAGITASTSETYWNGALSSWGVSLVQRKAGSVSTLPYNGKITYGDAGNPQDLLKYRVFVLVEPNILFTSAEKTALLSFVNQGGGLFLIADHNGSDRNNDGEDSVDVINDFLGNGGLNPFGVTVNANNISVSAASVNASAADPLTHGAAGVVTNFTYHAGATLTINPTANATVKAAVWSSAARSNGNVMAAYGFYGKGRFVVIGDSSPADDGTGDSGDDLYNGWSESGAQNGTLITNASLFLAVPEPGTIALLGVGAVAFGIWRRRRS